MAQSDSSLQTSRRVKVLVATATAGYTAGIVAMNQLWYKNQPRSNFHFFNDSQEWQQVDKIGHVYTTYIESELSMRALIWAGVPPHRAALSGAISGFLFQLPVEILDGFAARYGASFIDLSANAIGSVLMASQYMLWQEQRIGLKFSFHPTPYAALRPAVLGKGVVQQVFKDYNGQTYWAAFNLCSFGIPNKLPAWLNLTVGYGAEGMIFADQNFGGLKRFRQYYLSLDFNLRKIPTKKKGLRVIMDVINILHFPLPALEINQYNIKFHPIYF